MLSSLPDQPQVDGTAWVRASQYKPDAWAEAKRRADRLGIAPEVVERNPTEVSRLELRQSLDTMRRENPSLADWLMRDDNLTVAQDDLPAMSKLASSVQSISTKYLAAPARGFYQGIGSGISGLGDLLDAAAYGLARATGGEDTAAQYDKDARASMANPSNWLRSLGGWLSDGGLMGTMAQISSDLTGQQNPFKPLKQGESNTATAVLEGVGNLAGQAAATIASPTAGVSMLLGQGADQQADMVRQAGAEGTGGAYAAIAASAPVAAALEKIGLSRILKYAPNGIKNTVARYIMDKLAAAGVEATSEAAEQVVYNSLAYGTYNPKQSLTEGVQSSAEVGGAVGLIARVLFGHGYRMSRERGQQENEQVDTLTKIVQQSKTWQRDPAKMENAIASLKGAGVENVYLPGEAVMTLYQSSPEMAQVFEAAGVSRDKVNESILTGADLSVPMETYLTRIAPKYHGELGKSARLSPDTITEADADATDEQNAAVDRFLASVNEAPPEGDADMRVYNDVLGQLLGTYSQADAEVMAGVVNGMFRDGIARRAGVDPMELYQRYGLRVVDEMKRRYPPDRVHPEFDADLERLRTGDIPTEDVALGPTIGEFLSERGIRSAPNEPMSGEIRRLNENDRFTRAGRRRLVREDDPNALTLDYAREAAVEAGYLPEGSDINDLLDALENDARPISPANQNAQDTRLRLTSLADELARQGLDVNALSNGEIRRALMGGVATDPEVMNFDQSGDAAFTESDYRPEVVSWAREKFGEMVAPNGRPAWQNFVAWFGDSKVVDADGKPLVVYHGTKGDFDVFGGTRDDGVLRVRSGVPGGSDVDAPGGQFWFTTDPQLAFANGEAGSSVMPVYVRIENPIRRSGYFGMDDFSRPEKFKYFDKSAQELVTPDGVIGDNGVVVAFRPEQIKSATGNNGNFDQSNPSILNQPAYHGTPHTVDRFSLQKIGTGEGAQAFGWGLYFASEKAIAEHYKKVLADGALTYDGELLKRGSPEEKAAQLIIAARNGDEYAAELMEPGTVFIGYDTPKVHAAIASMDAGKVREAGNLYRVEVPEDSDLLDWDKPLSEQPEKVRDELVGLIESHVAKHYVGVDGKRRIMVRVAGQERVFLSGAEAKSYLLSNMTGQDVYLTLAQASSPQKASAELNTAGIPGLRYLDGNSRNPFPFDVQVFGKSGALLKYEKVRSRAAADAMVADAEAAGNTAKVIERPVEAGSHNYVIWDEGAISEPMRLAQQRRGYLQFGADRQFTIGLTEARNLSTFMHEIGHLGLEVMSDMASTDPVFAEEFGILTRWWQDNADAVIATADRDVRDTINAAGGADFLRMVAADFRGDYDKAGVAAKTALHEYFARGFERYLAEGKPPTPELARPFSRFKAWLKAIYKSLVNLNVDLNDEVRGFMARMIAGDEAVVEAERASVAEPLFKEAARAGMSEAKFKAYLELQAKAHEDAEARVTAEAYREVMREREAWWREESARVESEVRAEFEALPVYRAWEALARNREPNGTPLDTPQVKLSKDWLLDRYGQDWLNKNLLRKQVYSADGGVHGDVVAPMFGFNTGSELVEALSNAQPLAKAVRTETQNRMRERYGDMRNDGTLPEKAMRAVHGSRRVKVIEAEIAALAGLANEPAMTAKQARDWANRQLAGRTVRDVVPYTYLRAERKAAREAVKAAAAGKMTEALAASRRRLVNAVMYDEAAKVRERVDRLQQRVKKLAKRPAQERMAKAGGEWSEVLNSVLDAVGVRQLGPGEQRIDLSKWIDKHTQDGTPNPIPQSVEDLVTSGRVQSIKEMPVSLMDDVREAIKNITKQSNTASKVIVDGKRVDYAEQQQRVVDTLNRVLGAGDVVFSEDELRALDAIMKHGGELAGSLLPTETLVERLDGGKSGPMHDLFWNPAMEARNRRADLRREVAMPLVQRVESWSKADRNRMREQVPMKSLGGLPLSRFQLLGMALHMGTPSSLDVLMRGGRWINGQHYEFGQPVIDEAIQNLSKDDWDLVSDIWTMMGDRLWNETVALQKRTGGIVPKRLETRDIETPHGTVKGGYFPLIAARGQSNVGRKVEESEVIGMATAGISRATTSKSRLQERTGAAYPLELNLETLLTSSVDKVITDISHREFVVQANKVLTDSKIISIINDRVNPGVVKSMLGATNHAVRMGGDFDPAMRFPDKLMNNVVTNATAVALGFRFALGIANYGTAWPQAAARIGNGNIVKATGLMASSFVRTFGPSRFKAIEAQVHALSPYMKGRADEFESTYRDAMKSLVGKQSLRAKTIRMGLSYIIYVDRLSSIPIWNAAFEEQRAAGASVQDAVREADKTIRSTQTDGSDISLSAFERSGKWRLFKMFIGPMLIQGARIRDAVAKKGASYDMSYPERMGVLLATWVVTALIFDLLAGRWPDDNDDDDDVDGKDWARWALVKVGLYPFQTIPAIRDAASVVESKALGKPVFGRNNPLSDAAIVFANAGDAAWEYSNDALDEDEDADEAKLLKAAAKAGAIATGAPYIAADTAGQFIYDVGTGEYEPASPTDLRYLFVRRPKEKQ